jgi:hypothetical protein
MDDGYKMLEKVIPYGAAAEVAKLMGVSLSTLDRWTAKPLTTEDPDARGRRNPIDYFIQLYNAVFLVNPDDADLLIDRVLQERARLRRIHKRDKAMPPEQVEGVLREASRQLDQAADAIAGLKS